MLKPIILIYVNIAMLQLTTTTVVFTMIKAELSDLPGPCSLFMLIVFTTAYCIYAHVLYATQMLHEQYR